MVTRETYEPDPSFQLVASAGPTGKYDCTAHSASNAIDYVTMGAKDPGGRTIRLQSNEAIPDPKSPGLNLGQVQNVALSKYGVYLDVRTGSRALTWQDYERRKDEGQGGIIQVGYTPIANSKYDAFGSRFFGGHAMFECRLATYDPGADGLHGTGRWKHDGTVYTREIMKRAAGELVLGPKTKVGYNRVWCAMTRDVIPDYRVSMVPASSFHRYYVENGVIVDRSDPIKGRSFSAPCTVPLSRLWPVKNGGPGRRYSLVRIKEGAYKNWYIHSQFAREI